MKQMHREISAIALPAIITNITVPLLGLIDLTIAGHLGNETFIGAMSVSSMIFNLIYWNFGFLRMGTSGLTAQAFGGGDSEQMRKVLHQAGALALVIAACILLAQWPLQWIALQVIHPTEAVADLARTYFYIVIWGVPAILLMMAAKGWFLGMQNSRTPMAISIAVNVINVITSLIAVYVLKLGFIGIATGTLVAEYAGLMLTIYLLARHRTTPLQGISLRVILSGGSFGRFWRTNTSIFLRSVCMMLVTLTFVSVGARSGNTVLAVNALIMQLFVLFSYFMDGIAFAGEALVGKYYGARNLASMRHCIKHLFVWGAVVTALFTAFYGLLPRQIFSLLTDQTDVVVAAMDYRWWCVAIPITAVAAFVYDGVCIGLTDAKGMFFSVFFAAVTFFVIEFFPEITGTTLFPFLQGNNRLWLAFITYLLLRSLILHFRLSRKP